MSSSTMATLTSLLVVACLLLQLVSCNQAAAAASENSLEEVDQLLELTNRPSHLQLKRSGEPNIVLLMMKLYEPFIPKQIMEAISQQAGPLGEQWTQQLMSMPGFEQFYTQFEGFVNTLSNMGGASSLISGLTSTFSGGQLTDLASSFGRR